MVKIKLLNPSRYHSIFYDPDFVIQGLSLSTASLDYHLDAVLQTVQLPAGIGHLTASLADVDGDAFPHFEL